MPFVIKRTDTNLYAKRRRPWLEQQWTSDLQLARVFSNKSAATNSNLLYVYSQPNPPIPTVILSVELREV